MPRVSFQIYWFRAKDVVLHHIRMALTLALCILSHCSYKFRKQTRSVGWDSITEHLGIAISKCTISRYSPFPYLKTAVMWVVHTIYYLHFEGSKCLPPPFCAPGLQRRKIMVIDLDETLIHSVLDGMSRQTTGSGSPPDFVLKMDVDHHPVRFSVHKRPHVDYFLNIVSHLPPHLICTFWLPHKWGPRYACLFIASQKLCICWCTDLRL